MKKRIELIEVESGSGNVYADLGLPDADAMLRKARLVAQIGEILQARRVTQAVAARTLGLTQPRVSALLRGDFQGVSEQRLLECLTALGRDVEIIVRPASKSRATGRLTLRIA